jgi:hypothetical protein
MELIIGILKNIGPFIAAIVGVLSALIALFLIIPGDQPEKSLQGIVEFLKKFSLK